MSKEELLGIRKVFLYIADCLAVVADMQEMHNCNDCGIKKTCEYVPMPGQNVRWNCPLWKEKRHGKE